jgi:hypothetical protein
MTLTDQGHFMLIFLTTLGEFAVFKKSLLPTSAHDTDERKKKKAKGKPA